MRGDERRSRGRRRIGGAPIAAAAGAALLLGLVPGTAGAFSASVRNSTDTAAAASRFTCQDTFAATQNRNNAYFEYQLTSTAGTTTDQGSSGTIGTYRGTHAVQAATGADACARDNPAAPNVYLLDGTTDHITVGTAFAAPTTFSLAVWFRAGSRGAGVLMGMGSAATGANSVWDRALSLNASAQLVLTVNKNSSATQTAVITSPAGYADGSWHQAVATMSGAGMKLYVDGAVVGSDPNSQLTAFERHLGAGRIGSDGDEAPSRGSCASSPPTGSSCPPPRSPSSTQRQLTGPAPIGPSQSVHTGVIPGS